MVDETKQSELPQPDEVAKVLFKHFCESCELGEEGCVQQSGLRCPAFDAVQVLCPDNPFVLRILGKYMQCPKCGVVGMSPPSSAFNAPQQPVLVCLNCGAPLWRGVSGVLVQNFEDINRSFAFRFVEEDGALVPREVEWPSALIAEEAIEEAEEILRDEE